jgi:ATP/maltotriose-dependent transcriptional regulator MalT
MIQTFDREAELAHLFPGKNDFSVVFHPVVLFAPVGSGKTTILMKGSVDQPATLLCSLRSNERLADSDTAEFVREFTESIGLLPRDSGWVAAVDSVARMAAYS